MASIRQLILDSLETALNNILTDDDYNTDIQKVITGKILPIEKYPSGWRQAMCQIRYAGQTNRKEDGHSVADVTYQCYASMSNATTGDFMMFLDDIEATLDKDPSREGLSATGYNTWDTYTESIAVLGTEEFDEMLDSSTENHKEIEAMIVIKVTYVYFAALLSGI